MDASAHLDGSLIQAVSARYTSRWEQGWARGKLGGDPVYSAVFERLPETGRLLDIGCGEGYLLALLAHARPALSLVGLDHDARRLDIARRALPPEVELLSRDAREVQGGGFDVITCLDVLHYMPPDQQDALIAELSGLLLPGGRLMVRDAEASQGARSWITTASERLMVAVGRHKGDGVFFRTREATVQAMEAAGLRVEVAPCQAGTPFSNLLFVAARPREPDLPAGQVG